MDSIPAILADLAAGKMVLIVDDEGRENEGDLVLAAEKATPEAMNFMLREARGMMCVALAPEICAALDLQPQSAVNTSGRTTAYTVSVDAGPRFGVSTGVSAFDRAATCRVLADALSRPGDLVRPGHMHPLRARTGGCLVRAGHTECSVDLCRLAGLRPAAVIIEVMNEDGTMARQEDLKKICAKHGIRIASVAEVIGYRLERDSLVRRVETAKLQTAVGEFDLFAYRSEVDTLPHLAITCGGIGVADAKGQVPVVEEPVLVRVHRQDILADVLGELGDGSDRMVQKALEKLQQEGRGALVYLRHDGVGTGLLGRLQSLNLNPDETASRSEMIRPGEAVPSTPGGMRHAYGIGAQILRDLGLRQLRLISNHPVQPNALSGFGLTIAGYEAV